MKAIFVVSGLLAALCAGAAVDYTTIDLKNYMSLCDRNALSRDECFKESFQSTIDRFSAGIAEIGLPQFDPLIIQNTRFTFSNPLVLLSSLAINKARVIGLSKSKVISVKSDFTDNEMRAVIDVEIPKIFTEGVYKGAGRYTNLSFGPKGYFNVTATDITARIIVAGRTEQRDGETFMIMRKFDLTPKIGDLKTNAEGLFPDIGLNALANELINSNWRAFFDAMINEVKAIWEPVLLEHANSFFSVVPYRTMFL